MTLICIAAQVAFAKSMDFKPIPRSLDASMKPIIMTAGDHDNNLDGIPLSTPDFSLLSRGEPTENYNPATAVRVVCKDRTGQSYSHGMAGFDACMSDSQFQALDYDKTSSNQPQL